MATYKQDDQIAEIKTQLGDKLVLTHFSGTEGMSRLFEFRADTVSEDDGAINFDKQLGQNVTVTLHTDGEGDRYFVGTCTEVVRTGRSKEGYHYLLVLRPALWLLSKRINSRVFQNMNVRDILVEVLNEHGITPEDSKLREHHPEIEYCVQHKESDLNFVLRLMEAEGISYHFAFADNTQTLVLCDSKASYEGIGTRKYRDTEEYHWGNGEHFYRWMPERRFTTNSAVMTDYKLQQPGDDNRGEFVGDAKFSPLLEDYHHPFPHHLGEGTSPDFGKSYAEVRALSERTGDNRHLAFGNCGSLVPGSKVTLADHSTEDGEYVVLTCKHMIAAQYYRSTDDEAGDEPYRGEYQLMKLARYVPPIVTSKPVVGGPQTGVVVGDTTAGGDNEIHTDEYGRIRVHMHWNREDKGKKEGQTMWCRVAQVWAGPHQQWGAIFIPRVGMEVLVEFLDGDPDRPIVTGCVYHKDNMPPYELPADAFMAGWKSNFEDGSGYNEIVMIDTKNEEKIRVHTTLDLLTEVERDETREVDKNRTTTIGVNDTHDVGEVLAVTAGVKISLTVGPSSITLTQQGITIEAPMIDIHATGKLTTRSDGIASHTSTGPMTIKGAMVNIN